MSMRSVFLDVQLDFASKADAVESEEILLRFLGVVARLSLFQLRRNPKLPKLYASGVKYCPPDQMEGFWVDKSKIRELGAYLKSIGATDEHAATVIRLVSGVEIFQDILTLYKLKKGDCDRLVCARLAELWQAGIQASPYLIAYPNQSGGTTYHAVVLHADNTTEDPSLILGMGGSARAASRKEEIRKNYERRDNLVKNATDLMITDGYSPEMLGCMIDDAAYVPAGGFR